MSVKIKLCYVLDDGLSRESRTTAQLKKRVRRMVRRQEEREWRKGLGAELEAEEEFQRQEKRDDAEFMSRFDDDDGMWEEFYDWRERFFEDD